MKVRLEVAKSKANVKRVVLTRDTTIGRAPDCNLRIASGQVSRKHCEVLVGDAGVFVRDLGSSNGTFVGDQKLEPYEDTPVPPGSTLSVGGVRFRVRYELADSLVDSGGSTVNVPRPEAGAAANDTVRDGDRERTEVAESELAEPDFALDEAAAEAVEEVAEEAIPDFEATDTFVTDDEEIPVFDAEFDDGFEAVEDDAPTIDSNIHDLALVDTDEADAEVEVEEVEVEAVVEPEEEAKPKRLRGWGKKKSKKPEEPAAAVEAPSEEAVAVFEVAEEPAAAEPSAEPAPEAEETVRFDFGEEETTTGESGNLADFLQNLD